MQHTTSTGVADACAEAMKRARHVAIDDAAIAATCQSFPSDHLPVPEWNRDLHFFEGTEKSANYVLVLDALNFSFWADAGQPRWKIDYRGRELQGYWALSAALKRAVEDGVPLLEAGWLAEATRPQVERLLAGTQGEIPLMAARQAHLNEVGRVLLQRYDGLFTNMVEDVGHDAVDLALRVAAELTSFDDVATLGDLRVPIYKRAQILPVDLYGTYDGRSWGDLRRLDQLTAFADYKVPQVLRRQGILRYDEELSEIVDQERLIDPGHPMEVEIRAATVDAVERMRACMAARGQDVRAFEIDWLLWGLGQTKHPDDRPYHKTRTIYY